MEELARSGCRVLKSEPMSKHTTMGVGGPAEYFLEVESVEQLNAVREISLKKKLPIFFAGMGSNLLVSDKGLPGFVVRLKGAFETVEIKGPEVRAGAGV